MENQDKLNSSKEIIAFLVKSFPCCFISEGNVRPLKIRIFQDILIRLNKNDNITKTKLRSALRIYTSSWRYLYSIKKGVKRVDLDGNDCSDLKSEHIEYACQKIIEAKARIQAQRTLEKLKKLESQKKTRKMHDKDILSSTSYKKSKISFSNIADIINKKNKNNLYDKDRAKKINNNKISDLVKSESITDISTVKIGQVLKITVGKSVIDASVIEIVKGGVRVQLLTGLAMIIGAKHLK
ncbi:MAG: RNA chaperone ProQ [Arsenophonus sp. ER-EMS1-MAG3]